MRRRCLLFTMLLILILLVFSRSQSLKTVTVNIARHPGVADVAISLYIEEHKLFEKIAQKYGYDVKINRINFPSGVAALEAMLAGKLDITIIGQIPALNIVSRQLPVYLGSGSAGGRNGHALVVRPKSDIHSLDDLVKKKAVIATVIGSTGHQFLELLFKAAYGKTPQELGLQVLDMPPGQAITFPQGVDAVALWSSFPEQMIAKGTGAILVTDFGYTGPAWTAPPGPGKRLDFVKNSPFYPEGFTLYRNFTAYRREFVDKYPDLVIAYLEAVQTACKALNQKTSIGKAIAWRYVKDLWNIPRDLAMRIFADDLSMGIRGWIWVTYGDVKAITWSSKWAYSKKLIPREVSWEDVKSYFKTLSSLEEKAYKNLGSEPPIEEMTKSTEKDIRGLPTWKMSEWPDEPTPE